MVKAIKKPRGTGKVIGRFTVSPLFLQRSALIALLSFFFFLAMLVGYSLRGQFGYLILAAAFFVLHIFSLSGVWMLRKKSIGIFENGLEFRRRFIAWSELEAADFPPGSAGALRLKSGETIQLPANIERAQALESYIVCRLAG